MDAPGAATADVDSYRRLADVFHDVLSEQSLESLLVRIADTLAEIVPYEALHIYEADEAKRELMPALVRSEWASEILSERFPFGEGITGWAVEHRQPVLEPGAPRPARSVRARHAGRPRGADRRAARRPRLAEGHAERVPHRRGREPIDQLGDVCSIVRACHERWDGAGYPDRKAGDEIPLEARIIFACDAFHAMTTDRPYRRALPVEEALQRLEEAAGTQFDPTVVGVCVRLLEAPPA